MFRFLQLTPEQAEAVDGVDVADTGYGVFGDKLLVSQLPYGPEAVQSFQQVDAMVDARRTKRLRVWKEK